MNECGVTEGLMDTQLESQCQAVRSSGEYEMVNWAPLSVNSVLFVCLFVLTPPPSMSAWVWLHLLHLIHLLSINVSEFGESSARLWDDRLAYCLWKRWWWWWVMEDNRGWWWWRITDMDRWWWKIMEDDYGWWWLMYYYRWWRIIDDIDYRGQRMMKKDGRWCMIMGWWRIIFGGGWWRMVDDDREESIFKMDYHGWIKVFEKGVRWMRMMVTDEG